MNTIHSIRFIIAALCISYYVFPTQHQLSLTCEQTRFSTAVLNIFCFDRSTPEIIEVQKNINSTPSYINEMQQVAQNWENNINSQHSYTMQLLKENPRTVYDQAFQDWIALSEHLITLDNTHTSIQKNVDTLKELLLYSTLHKKFNNKPLAKCQQALLQIVNSSNGNQKDLYNEAFGQWYQFKTDLMMAKNHQSSLQKIIRKTSNLIEDRIQVMSLSSDLMQKNKN